MSIEGPRAQLTGRAIDTLFTAGVIINGYNNTELCGLTGRIYSSTWRVFAGAPFFGCQNTPDTLCSLLAHPTLSVYFVALCLPRLRVQQNGWISF